MNPSTFDELTKLLAMKIPRRTLMKQLFGLTVASSSLAWLNACGTTPPPSYTTFDVFDEINRLLDSKQGIDQVRIARAADGQGPSLLHFQPFWVGDSTVPNSMEMHTDGVIYIAYTHPLTPVWYDSNGSPAAANDASNSPIKSGSSGTRPFQSLKSGNVNIHNWRYYTDNLPPGRRPATRWFTIPLPPKSPNCDPDRGCPMDPSEWLTFLRSGDPRVQQLIRHQTQSLPNSGDYCGRGFFHGFQQEWGTILPAGGNENGQRTFGTHYISWEELIALEQSSPDAALDVLAFRGLPSSDTYDHTVPWISSVVEGFVTNSFLSGGDYVGPKGAHMDWPGGYWLGNPEPWHPEGCGTFTAKNALCDDWIIFVKPDPEYYFLLASDPQDTGNFDAEHSGNVECEIEQWVVPGGYRPEPGDRISMTGRWVIDCGPGDWHGEIHPYESYVSSHAQTRSGALGGTEVIASVVVTGAWQGEGGALFLDIWPPTRPTASATLHYSQDQPGAMFGLTVNELLLPGPGDNPNHLHLTVLAPQITLGTGGANDVYYTTSRRLATKYHLWWE